MADRKEVFLRLQQSPRLPTPSRTALEIMRLCRSETASLPDIARVIELDPALSAELIRYANSALMSTGTQVVSVQKATINLGMKTVVNLALGFSLLSAHTTGKCENFDYDRFWSLSLAQAIATKTTAMFASGFDGDELFVSALLSHVGRLALASCFPDEYSAILEQVAGGAELRLAEQKRFAIDNAELTAELLLDWGIPPTFALAAGFHEELSTAELGTSTTLRIAEILNLCLGLAELSLHWEEAADRLPAIEEQAGQLALLEVDFPVLFDAVTSAWLDWSEKFRIPMRDCPSYGELRARISGDA